MRLIAHQDYAPVKPRALAEALSVTKDDYEAFASAVERLRQQGKIVVAGRNGRISLPEMADQIVGTFQASSRGFGFVRPDKLTAQGDLYIPSGAMLDAITGDKVVAKVTKARRRDGTMRLTGRITEVLSRNTAQFVGKLMRDGRQWFVAPDGRAATEIISVDDPGAKNAHLGDKVLVEILSFATSKCYAHGVIIEKLGKSGTSQAELKSVIRRYRLEDKFSRSALQDARRSIENFDSEAAIAAGTRRDIRDQTVITIDPADARDFDDAISLKKLPHGNWQLGVHIADVSHFVQLDSYLDKEACARATSVYLPQHVIAMLPETLSNGLCSLQEGQDRFVKTAYVEIDANGKALTSSFANSVIRSTRRLTYENVDEILAGKTEGFSEPVLSLVRDMAKLAGIIHKRRIKDGMLTLEIPKADLVYDDKGRVIDAHPESTSFSHTIIEMFMIEANEAVARLLDSLGVDFLRRVHADPDSLAAGEMARVIKLCGYVIPAKINRQGLQKLLQSVSGKPESCLIKLAVLKSLQKAQYSPVHIGHYALASKHYCHFTSPIRRYPDLTIHRLLQAWLNGALTEKTTDDFPDFAQLDTLGQHCSDRERNAESAENDLRSLKILQLLEQCVGQDIKGMVTSITNFGMFVQLEKYLFDGLVSAEDVLALQAKSGRGKHNKPAKGRGHIKQAKFTQTCPYKLGQELMVRIAAVNTATRTLDLIPTPDK
jgi:ribonuclease R